MVRGQADLISPERQMHTCNLWLEIQDQSYTIEWYEDIDGHRSGRQEKGRPGWQSLLAQLDRPEVAGVIADSFDRMYRNVHQFLNFLNRIEHLNKKLITVKEGLDTSSTLGRAIVTILMVIYQLESDQTSDRMTANVKYKREVLGRHWGPAPFGCDRNEEGQLIPTAKTYWLNPLTGQAQVADNGQIPAGYEPRRYLDGLTALYEHYTLGQSSYDTTAEVMNQAGWRYYADAKAEPRSFNRDDIRRIVSFWRIYRGELVIGNSTNDHDAPIVKGGHDPILPVELCNQVGSIKQDRGREYSRRSNVIDKTYLLSDVIYCAVCGKALKGQYHKGRRSYRHYGGKLGCPEKMIEAESLEQQVLAYLSKLGDSVLLTKVLREAERLARNVIVKDEQTRTIIDQLDQDRARLNRLEDTYLDGDIDRERYLSKRAEIQGRIITSERQIYTANKMTDIGAIVARIQSTMGQLEQANEKTKKTLINSLIERLDVAGGKVITFTPRAWAQPFF
jgi:DNA invertase Pin-like site-specific DNA recombinase